MPKRIPPQVGGNDEEIRKRCEALELENAVLRETIEVLKKDPRVDPRELSNKEKTQVIGALKGKWPIELLLKSLLIPRSSYYFHQSG